MKKPVVIIPSIRTIEPRHIAAIPEEVNLKKGNLDREVHGEHYGHLMSPYFYGFIDTGLAAIAPVTYASMYFDLFSYLADDFEGLAGDLGCPPLYRTYFIETFERLQRWGAIYGRPGLGGCRRREGPIRRRMKRTAA